MIFHAVDACGHTSARQSMKAVGAADLNAPISSGPYDAPGDRAEAFMLTEAQHHDAKGLRILGRRLLEVIDPDLADAEEAKRLEAEEVAARAAASFTIADDGHGQCHGRFTLPRVHGAMLRDALVQVAGPPPTKHRLGEAFMTLIEQKVSLASVKRTAPKIVEVAETSPAQPAIQGSPFPKPEGQPPARAEKPVRVATAAPAPSPLSSS